MEAISNDFSWSCLKTRGKIPPSRDGHTACVTDDYMYICGGFLKNLSSEFLEVYQLNFITLEWEYLYIKICFVDFYSFKSPDESDTYDFSWSCLKTRGKIPPSRDGHTACVTDDYMYICGGFLKNLSSEFLEVYQLNFITLEWEYLYIKNNVPYWKDFHSAVFIDKKMYLFGGQQLKRKQKICSNELIYLDTETMTWNYLYPKGNVPQGRRSHSAFVYRKNMYIFGGYNSIANQFFNDLYLYKPTDNTWELVRTIGKGPSPRRRQSCCIIDDQVVIFGGASPKTSPSAKFSLETNNFIDKYLIYQDDIFMLNLFLPLKTLSMIKIINENIDISKLPEFLRKEIFKYCKNQHECI
ncbi:kelch domain-containing protein 3-like [Centruroides sculpturatus]|uniref:kelch domain-containing protein 3-like n=1 Tax=Centruroides sculpturatus TaxID=218467 RepID=UPI000C6ECDB0|nr:kelch domain-containing protein 3-like [Centruroides sculpturatus]